MKAESVRFNKVFYYSHITIILKVYYFKEKNEKMLQFFRFFVIIEEREYFCM